MLTATQILAGALLTGARWRRLLGVLVAFAALAIPWLMPNDSPLLRAILALGIAMTCLRSIDLVGENKPRPLWFRIAHVAIPFDTRRMHRAPSEIHLPQLSKILLYLALAFASMRMVIALGPSLENVPHVLLRWLGGLLFVYALSEVAYGGSEVLFRALGFEIYPLHRSPAASLSVKEFWGDRWNRTVSAWLREHCLKPLARRTNAKLGMLASFLVSGILHAYLALVALGWRSALLMLGYFLLQGALVAIEITFDSAHWNRHRARIWTLVWMIASSPLFIEPLLQIVGV
jgi:Membrane bound O-acyl transferase family